MTQARRGAVKPLRHIAVVTAVLLASVFALTGPSGAATLTYDGAFDGTQPTMPVVAISTPNCVTQGSTPVAYEVIPYTPLLTGDVSLSLRSDGGAGTAASVYVYENSFDPTAGLTNCIAASNNGNAATDTPTTLTYSATAGTQYYLVVFNDTFSQSQFGWELTVETVPAVDMAVGITAGGPYQPGARVPFAVEVTNIETDDADNAVVTITLPAEFDGSTIGDVVVGGTPAYACTPDEGAGTLTCTAAAHPVGDTATISFGATLVADLTDGQEIEVTAQVSVASPPDVNEANDTATATVVIDVPTTPTTPTSTSAAPAAAAVTPALVPRFTG